MSFVLWRRNVPERMVTKPHISVTIWVGFWRSQSCTQVLQLSIIMLKVTAETMTTIWENTNTDNHARSLELDKYMTQVTRSFIGAQAYKYLSQTNGSRNQSVKTMLISVVLSTWLIQHTLISISPPATINPCHPLLWPLHQSTTTNITFPSNILLSSIEQQI